MGKPRPLCNPCPRWPGKCPARMAFDRPETLPKKRFSTLPQGTVNGAASGTGSTFQLVFFRPQTPPLIFLGKLTLPGTEGERVGSGRSGVYLPHPDMDPRVRISEWGKKMGNFWRIAGGMVAVAERGVGSREEGPESPACKHQQGLCIPPFPSQGQSSCTARLRHTACTHFLSG